MKIVITNTFKKDFLKIFLHEKMINIFINKLKESNLIYLNSNIFKFKFHIRTLSVRWILLVNINDKYIPILIVKKSDKQFWQNLVFDKKLENKLLTIIPKIENDILENNFTTFNI